MVSTRIDGIFGNLKKFLVEKKTSIDGFVFQLHYKWTFLFLFVLSVSVGLNQLLGDPIDCISKDDIPSELLDTFCWVHSTFSLPDAWFKDVGSEIPYPGVDKYTPGQERVYHAYYQWVCWVLFFQSVFFYLPRYIWKTVEGKRIHHLTLGLDNPVIMKAEKQNNLDVLVQYIKGNLGKHRFYFMCYMLGHLLNLINVSGQIFVIDKFLGRKFATYGASVLQFREWNWHYDPMVQVFPRLVKCTFFRYGSSGDIQRHDAMCLLPQNVFNEKLYVGIWLWFLILLSLTVVDLCYRIVFFTVKPTWCFFMPSFFKYRKCLHKLKSQSTPGDWLLLFLLSENMEPQHFHFLIHKVDGPTLWSRGSFFDSDECCQLRSV